MKRIAAALSLLMLASLALAETTCIEQNPCTDQEKVWRYQEQHKPLEEYKTTKADLQLIETREFFRGQRKKEEK